MHGFRVTLSDGTNEVIEASEYVVDGDGDLELRGGGEKIKSFDLASWVEVTEVGNRLTETWPYPNMPHTVSAALGEMARYGYIPYGPLPDFDDWRLNDFDSLVAAILRSDGIDVDTSNAMEREIVHLVRGVIAKEFSVRWHRSKAK